MSQKKYRSWRQVERDLEKMLLNELPDILDKLFTETTGIPVSRKIIERNNPRTKQHEYIDFEEIKK